MAVTANISSTFAITVVPTDNTVYTVTNPGRAFKIVAIYANNTTAGAVTVKVDDSAGNAITDGAQSIGANSGAFAELVPGNLEVTAAENLVVQASAGGLNPIIIECVATGGGEALTTSP